MIKRCDNCGDRLHTEARRPVASDRSELRPSRRKLAEMEDEFPRTDEAEEDMDDEDADYHGASRRQAPVRTAPRRPVAAATQAKPKGIKSITASIDEVATKLERSGRVTLAKKLDSVSILLEKHFA